MTGTAASTLRIKVLLFASFAESLGSEVLELALGAPATVRDALERLRSFPGGDRLPPKPLCALNLQQTNPETLLSDGDELAVLPPVSGG